MVVLFISASHVGMGWGVYEWWRESSQFMTGIDGFIRDKVAIHLAGQISSVQSFSFSNNSVELLHSTLNLLRDQRWHSG